VDRQFHATDSAVHMIQTTGKIISSVTDGLKDRPLALALVLVNVLFLIMTSGLLYSVNEHGLRRDKLISDLVANCQPTR
jgi:hypothetical protein